MLVHDLFEILTIRDNADPSKDVDPKEGDCFMVFFRLTRGSRELPQGLGHFSGGFRK